MNTPSLKSLALAAVEADAAMKKENHLTTKYALLKESHDALGAFHSVATPERILQYRDEVLDEAAKWHDDLAARLETESEQYSKSHPQTFSMIMVNMHKSSAEAIRSLKSKEPSP